MQANHRIDEVQTRGCEVEAALELFETCDLSNVIHAAKITRLGEAHKQNTQAYLAKVKGEIASNNMEKGYLHQIWRQVPFSGHK